MTSIETQVWTAAFGARQPQPYRQGADSAQSVISARYWAAAAVFSFRGEMRNPTQDDARKLHEEALIASQRERMGKSA